MDSKTKVFAYITHGARLLVFEQPDFPDIGIQVPACSLEVNEAPKEAVMREAYEETGLDNLELLSYLGETQFDLSIYDIDEIHHRKFYHLKCETIPPEHGFMRKRLHQ